ncbi:hypothetical protein DFA_01536 [Cavenderia fasciculata]|uniref:Ankyrin repeat-containing protein n=1 Tax=Cavenderia fasciculata TaxID=261658 RepID=F4PTC8_CACFS|nr:uncharacterized protein DFA_01536 [Cavenderia fasciculata]EGG21650.1 hypothetical protein DFA_01536 [Cavenderia fasciculata]|eukprot:XP_004359500.1 hypothetical protein DFA_01536 [Cavenderia fasciculata]
MSCNNNNNIITSRFFLVFRNIIIQRRIFRDIESIYKELGEQSMKGKDIKLNDNLLVYLRYGRTEEFIRGMKRVIHIYPPDGGLIKQALVSCDQVAVEYLFREFRDKLILNLDFFTFKCMNVKTATLLIDFMNGSEDVKRKPIEHHVWSSCASYHAEKCNAAMLSLLCQHYSTICNGSHCRGVAYKSPPTKMVSQDCFFETLKICKQYQIYSPDDWDRVLLDAAKASNSAVVHYVLTFRKSHGILCDLFDIAAGNNLQLLDYLYQEHNIKYGQKGGAFISACFSGNMEIMKYLFETMPPSATVCYNHGLEIALYNSHMDVANYILDNQSSTIKAVDPETLTPSKWIVNYVGMEILSIELLERLVNHPNVTTMFNWMLGIAISARKQDIVQYLISLPKSDVSFDLEHALCQAASINDLENVKLVLEYNGFFPHTVDVLRECNDNEEIVEYIIQTVPSIQVDHEYLHRLISTGYPKTALLMLKYNRTNFETDLYNQPILQAAAAKGSKELIKQIISSITYPPDYYASTGLELLLKGCVSNQTTKQQQQNPLLLSTQDIIEMIDLCFSKSTTIPSRCYFPYSTACKLEDFEIFKHIFEMDTARVGVPSQLLEYAAFNNRLDIVKFINEQFPGQLSALSVYALESSATYGNLEMIHYLKDNGLPIPIPRNSVDGIIKGAAFCGNLDMINDIVQWFEKCYTLHNRANKKQKLECNFNFHLLVQKHHQMQAVKLIHQIYSDPKNKEFIAVTDDWTRLKKSAFEFGSLPLIDYLFNLKIK